jgi:hypothetical protein
MGFGPDFDLSYDPAAHVSITLSGNTRLQFGGDGANEQGLLIYNPNLTGYYAILRSAPGVDDAYGAQLRAGTRLLSPGTYVFGGYAKVYTGKSEENPSVQWRSSRAGNVSSGNSLIVGWDDIIRYRESGLPEYDNDYNDLILTLTRILSPRTVDPRGTHRDGPDTAGPIACELWSVETETPAVSENESNSKEPMLPRRLVLALGGTDAVGI